jgi:hypothetical protein
MPLANKQEFPLWLTQIAHDRVFPEAAQIGCRPDGVLVRTKTQEGLARRVILTLGLWLSRARPEIASVIEVTRQAVGWFMPTRPETVLPGRIPLFILERGPDDVIYGFPDFEQRGVKVSADDRDPPPMDAELLPVSEALAEAQIPRTFWDVGS